MDKIKNFYEKYKIIDIIVIVLIIFIFSFLYCKHLNYILPDRGREFYLPQAILDGSVPYKDITLIYFPFSYYINALIYKILGISINSLIISQAFVCSIFMIIYYRLSREFLSRFFSFSLSLLVLSCCIFSLYDNFSYIIPYSYARVYGLLGYLICVYSLIKLHKTDNHKYSYWASLAAGFSICCKLEFFSILFFLFTGLLLYKKLNLNQYLRVILSFLIFSIITLSIMFVQGITFKEVTDAIVFGFEFAKTPVMSEHLAEAGMYPVHIFNNLKIFCYPFVTLISLLIASFTMCKLYSKYRNFAYPLFIFLIVWNYYNTNYSIQYLWLFSPLLVMLIFVLKFKSIKKDISILLLILFALLISQREFFSLYFKLYGAYSLPFILLVFSVLADRYIPKYIFKVSIKSILCAFFLLLVTLYSYDIWYFKKDTNFKIETSKGSIYTSFKMYYLLNAPISYINKHTDKNATVLVLPEGNIVNFITDRKVDMHCFMLDRLYYDAFGEKKSLELLKNSDSDYIILYGRGILSNFHRSYLYLPDETPLFNYINSNYNLVKEYSYITHQKYVVRIFEKNHHK